MFAECSAPRVLIGSRRASLDNSGWFAVRLTFAGIAKHLSARGGAHGIPLHEPSHHLNRVDPSDALEFGLVALTLLGVFAIALALMLPNSITP
jgi:hypothetical protein